MLKIELVAHTFEIDAVFSALSGIELAEAVYFDAKYPLTESSVIDVIRGVDCIEEFGSCVRFEIFIDKSLRNRTLEALRRSLTHARGLTTAISVSKVEAIAISHEGLSPVAA